MNNQTYSPDRRFFMQLHRTSPGKCVVCREGTKQMLLLLTTFSTATQQWKPSTFSRAHKTVQTGSLCASARALPTRFSQLSDTSEMNISRTSGISAARRASAKRLSSTASMRQSASAVCAQENAPLTQLPVQRQSPTQLMLKSALNAEAA